jgi:hypothetical protein
MKYLLIGALLTLTACAGADMTPQPPLKPDDQLKKSCETIVRGAARQTSAINWPDMKLFWINDETIRVVKGPIRLIGQPAAREFDYRCSFRKEADGSFLLLRVQFLPRDVEQKP